MTDCFTCPEPGNYAAIATILQRTALEAESCIFELETRLRQAVNQPTLIQPLSAGGIAANFLAQISLSTATFLNSPYSNFLNPMPRGIYHAGMSVNIIPTGAATDNSHRYIQIAVRNVYAAANSPNKYNAYQTVYESSTGNGMDMSLHTIIESDGNDGLYMYFEHGNLASTCNLTGVGWLTKISDLDAPRVVA